MLYTKEAGGEMTGVTELCKAADGETDKEEMVRRLMSHAGTVMV